MIPATMSELERVKEECKSMVNKRATASAAAAVVPVPGLDVGAGCDHHDGASPCD
ncbi:hypothetical protein [Mesobacillus sp. S13]|uniref:hypothetical protein n=1 Tax=Mesobacillus sp. S13 TaxID=2880221 RepID=UPI001CF28A08|nr:hypothetical protein [Mesobacillus sp. S13]